MKVTKSKWGPTSIMTYEIHPLGSNPFPKGSWCPTIRFSKIVRNDTRAFKITHTWSRTSKIPFQGKVMLNFHHKIYPRLGYMERFSPDLVHFCALPWILCCLVIRHAFSIISSLCITCTHIRHSYWDSLCQGIFMDFERLVCSSSTRLLCESYPDTLRWSEQILQSQDDCLISSYVSSLSKKPYTNLTQNRLSDLTILWEQLDISKKKRFCKAYCDIVSLISVPTEEPLLWAAIRFWDPSYRYFTFGKNYLVPTVEEYSVLIGLELQHFDKVYNQKPRVGWQKVLAQILKV